MSVDLGLSEDQQAIQRAFRGFFDAECPTTVARMSEPLGFDRELWTKLCAIDAPGMSVAAAVGGGGATLAHLVVVAEELGAHIAPVPLVDHLVSARLHPEPDIVSGSTIATLALRPADTTGRWRLVPGGAVADAVIGIDGDELVAVRHPAPSTAPRNHAAAPLADRSSREGNRVIIGSLDRYELARAEWKTLTAASLVGIAASALVLGVDYAKNRVQFGVPIGSFQAVQHGFADLPALIDGARLLTHKAAWAAQHDGLGGCDVDDNEINDFATLASMAFVFAADAAARVTDRSLHYHGGYGFSAEYDIQLFYRRARGWALVYGDPTRECGRLADRMFNRLVAN